MVSDKDAYVFLLKFVNDSLDIFDCDRVYTCERLIEHYEFRVDGQTAGDLSASALAAAELIAKIMAHLFKIEFSYQTLKLLGLIFAGCIGHLEHSLNIVLHTEFAEHACFLSEITDPVLGAFIHRKFSNIQVVKENLPLVRCNKAHSHVERGGFAGAIWPE
ncbi:unknown [Prevotella sp. CAG:1031]|nr:unknown [Prevotella sp. CAG:1031]